MREAKANPFRSKLTTNVDLRGVEYDMEPNRGRREAAEESVRDLMKSEWYVQVWYAHFNDQRQFNIAILTDGKIDRYQKSNDNVAGFEDLLFESPCHSPVLAIHELELLQHRSEVNHISMIHGISCLSTEQAAEVNPQGGENQHLRALLKSISSRDLPETEYRVQTWEEMLTFVNT